MPQTLILRLILIGSVSHQRLTRTIFHVRKIWRLSKGSEATKCRGRISFFEHGTSEAPSSNTCRDGARARRVQAPEKLQISNTHHAWEAFCGRMFGVSLELGIW